MIERSKVIDIMKGIGIILMVVGHAGCPTFLYNFIYAFHMALFFMISGWLISGRKPNLIKRIKALYWPFLFWGLLSLIMQYPLYKIGIYNAPYNYHDFLVHLFKILTFAQSEPITRLLWFLKSLFFSYMFISIFIWKTKNDKNMYFITGIVCFILLNIGYILYKQYGLISYDFQRELIIPWLLWLGFAIKTKDIILNNFYIIVLLILFLAISSQYITINLIGSRIGNPIILTLYSLIGFIMIYNIAYRIQNFKNKIIIMLTYIGRITMPILILHIICIKFMQIIMELYNLNVCVEEMFISPNLFRLFYSIIGILVPLLLNQLYINIKR